MICYFQCAISGFSKLISLQGGLIVGLLAWAGVRNWRTLMLVCSAPTGLIALLWFAIPESPRWLIAKGQWTLIPTKTRGCQVYRRYWKVVFCKFDIPTGRN